MKMGVELEKKGEGISLWYLEKRVANPRVENPQSPPSAAGRESKAVCDGDIMHQS